MAIRSYLSVGWTPTASVTWSRLSVPLWLLLSVWWLPWSHGRWQHGRWLSSYFADDYALAVRTTSVEDCIVCKLKLHWHFLSYRRCTIRAEEVLCLKKNTFACSQMTYLLVSQESEDHCWLPLSRYMHDPLVFCCGFQYVNVSLNVCPVDIQIHMSGVPSVFPDVQYCLFLRPSLLK